LRKLEVTESGKQKFHSGVRGKNSNGESKGQSPPKAEAFRV